jgi:hypothetical protein
MTNDNIETRRQYARAYWNLPIVFVEIDLDVLEILTNTMKSDEMMFARKLMDEKVPVWK